MGRGTGRCKVTEASKSWACGLPGKQSVGMTISMEQVEGDNTNVGWFRVRQPGMLC